MTRPRIWISSTTLPLLKARAAAGDDRWVSVKAAADRPADWSVGLGNYALAYLVTGDQGYAQKALSLLLPSCADGLNAITGDSGYQCRNALPAIAYCYDWLQPVLTAAQRSTLITTMKLWGGWPWPETTPSRAGAWGVDNPGSNYYHGFLFSWLVGLSLAGDDPYAQTLISVARNRFNAEVLPYLATAGKGGLWFEGCGYGTSSSGFLLWNLLANLTATGEDLIASTPWCAEAASAMLQFTKPDMHELAPFGDLAAGPLSDYARRVMLCLSAHDNRCAPWLDGITPNRNQQMLTRWEDFLWYTPASSPAPSQPLFCCAEGVQSVSSRTGWSSADTQLLATCGTTTESHQDRAQGDVLLSMGGEWLMAQAKMQMHSGISQQTAEHNCVTIDGAQQTWTQNQCKYLQMENTPQYLFLQMDLTAAYQATHYIRELFWLKPGLLLVRDLPTPTNPLSVVVWNLQVLNPVTLDPSGFVTVSPSGSKLFGTAAGVALFKSAPYQPDGGPKPTYRITLPSSPSGEFLVGLEPAPASQAARTVRPFLAAGLRGMCNGEQMVAAITSALPLTYTSPVTGMHTLYGLKPGGLYSGPGGGLSASPAGVIYFMGNAVGQPVTISEGGVIPPPTPQAYSITGTVTEAADGSMSGPVVLKPLP